MRNCPRYSRGSFEAEEMTRPRRKKIFFSTRLLVMTSVPVFCPRLNHWRRSPGSIVWRFPERPMTRKERDYTCGKKNGGPKAAVRGNAALTTRSVHRAAPCVRDHDGVGGGGGVARGIRRFHRDGVRAVLALRA